MGDAVANDNLRIADNILHIFLHGGDGKDTGYGGQSKEVRGVHTRDKTWTTDGGLCGLCVDAVSDGGVDVPSVYRGVTEFNRRRDAYTGCILWRDGVIDSGKCSVAHDEADRSDGSNAALRGIYEVRTSDKLKGTREKY